MTAAAVDCSHLNGIISVDYRDRASEAAIVEDDIELDLNLLADNSRASVPAKMGPHNVGGTEETDPDFANQLAQLQEMVAEMKEGFTGAMSALAQIKYGDQVLQQKVEKNKTEYEVQLADIVNMVLSLKSEFSNVLSQLHEANESQKYLGQQVEGLQFERDILLEELEVAGAISAQVRQRYHSGKSRPNGLNKSSDSTSLSNLLERARATFHSHHDNSHVTSDHDSGVNTGHHGDTSSCGEEASINPMVQSYIAGLQDSEQHHHHEEIPLDEEYHSDSSLTVAANKSLDMSRSLGDKCADITRCVSSRVVDDQVRDARPGKPDGERQMETEEEEQEEVEEVEEAVVAMEAPSQDAAPQSCTESINTKPTDQSLTYIRIDTPKKIAPHQRNTREVQRCQVARELMETERRYCSSLWVLIDHFAAPLKDSTLVAHREISVMFSPSLSRLYDHHCAFLQKLEERLSNWKWHAVVGDIVARFFESVECDLFHQYQVYVSEFPAALYHIRKTCRQSTRFRKYIRESQQDPICEGLDIGSYMLTPIQRVPRYVLLLKQLLKYTDREHPDYYHLESTLQRLGDFLMRLNDSIEYSMQVVASEETPKPKRKLRIGSSFRSSSLSSYDAMHMSHSTKDSGVHTDRDDHSILSNGRMFNLSFLRDSFRRRAQPSVHPTLQRKSHPAPHQVLQSAVVHNDKGGHPASQSYAGTPEQPSASSSRPSRLSYSTPEAADHTAQPHHTATPIPAAAAAPANRLTVGSLHAGRPLAEVQNQTLPVRGERKRRPRQRRPKSSGAEPAYARHPDSLHMSYHGQVPHIQMDGQDLYSVVVAPDEKLRKRRQRPKSMMEQMSDVSLYSSRPSSGRSTTFQLPATSQESLHTNTDTMSSMRSGALRQDDGRTYLGSNEFIAVPDASSRTNLAAVKSMPDVSQQNEQMSRQGINKSLPRMSPQNYGIFGEDEDDEDDDDELSLEESMYQPSLLSPTGVPPRRPQLLSRSQGCIVLEEGSGSPSQEAITQALARSLAEQNSARMMAAAPASRRAHPRAVLSVAEPQQQQQQHRARPHSAKPPRVPLHEDNLDARVEAEWVRPPRRRMDVWATSPIHERLVSDSPESLAQLDNSGGNRKKDEKKRKRDQKKPTDSLGDSGDHSKKKLSLKESIKSIFFKKRKRDKSHDASGVKSHDMSGDTSHDLSVLKSPSHDPVVSRVVEIGPAGAALDAEHAHDTSSWSHPRSPGRWSPREQAAPHDDTVRVDPAEPELETYEDENGDPCSAV